MRPVVISQTGAGQSTAVPLDRYLTPFQVAVSCNFSGTVVYSVEYTYDDVFNVAAGSIHWLTDPDIPVGTAGAASSLYTSPVSAVRINQASGSGTVTMTINQSGAR